MWLLWCVDRRSFIELDIFFPLPFSYKVIGITHEDMGGIDTTEVASVVRLDCRYFVTIWFTMRARITEKTKLIAKTQNDESSYCFEVFSVKFCTIFAIKIQKYATICHKIIALFTRWSFVRYTILISVWNPHTRMAQDIARHRFSDCATIR